MGTYNLPRNVKGEGRILFIFSKKSLITTGIGAVFGLPWYLILNAADHIIGGIVITVIFAAIGYGIGMFKVPENNSNNLFRKIGGEDIDVIIKKYIKFKMKKKKLYVYTKEDTK